jgi:hypothetical protein
LSSHNNQKLLVFEYKSLNKSKDADFSLSIPEIKGFI